MQIKAIVNHTKGVACAFKPNFGFYASMPHFIGFRLLAEIIRHIHETAPMVPVILDGKWNDIGNSSERYAFAALEPQMFGADALTVNPYLGGGSALSPFMELKSGDKGEIITARETGVLILCRTSNLDAAEIQDEMIVTTREKLYKLGLSDGDIERMCEAGCLNLLQGHPASPSATFQMPVYMKVAILASRRWNKYGNCGLVVGATVPTQLHQVRVAVNDMPLLIPGVGTQGGKIEEVVPAGMDSTGAGMIINNASKIMFASAGTDFADKAAEVAIKMNDDIKKAIAATRAAANAT